MTELERYKKALQFAEVRLHEISTMRRDILIVDLNALAKTTLAAMHEAIHPPPEMEEVTIERWECASCGNVEHEADHVACCTNYHPATAIKLTGHFQRPKPRPVERSVSGTVEWRARGGFTYPFGRGVNFDWDEILGKTGHLTFTWTEEER